MLQTIPLPYPAQKAHHLSFSHHAHSVHFRACQSMKIDKVLLHIIWASVLQPNIKYTILKAPSEKIIQRTVAIFRDICLSSDERGIIYMTSIDLTHQLANILCIQAYASVILPGDAENKEEKSRRFQAWCLGQIKWVVATVCFTEDVDFPSMWYAIIIKLMDMLSFLQESGHLGHDGITSYAITLRLFVPHYLLHPIQPDLSVPHHFLEVVSCFNQRDYQLAPGSQEWSCVAPDGGYTFVLFFISFFIAKIQWYSLRTDHGAIHGPVSYQLSGPDLLWFVLWPTC